MKDKELTIIHSDGDYLPESCYFKDKKRKIDFVLVILDYDPQHRIENDKLQVYISNLEKRGIQIEKEIGIRDSRLVFLKLHMPRFDLYNAADVYSIDFYYERGQYWTGNESKEFSKTSKCTKTVLIDPNPDNPVYKRSPLLVGKIAPLNITSSERTCIVYEILLDTFFGENHNEVGILRLLDKHLVKSAYGLHDGRWTWTTEGPLSSRQLLAKYWANWSMWYKQQPLHLIARYFGTEIAFFFAWLGFYTKMLFPVVIIGIICTILGVATLFTQEANESREVCKSHYLLCPLCLGYKFCKFTWLNSACTAVKLAYITDNLFTISYGFFMMFWAQLFYIFWKRRQRAYVFWWNVGSKNIDMAVRPEYERKVKTKKFSYITGEEEPHMTASEKGCRLAVSGGIVSLLILVMILATVSRVVLRLFLIIILQAIDDEIVTNNSRLAASALSSLINAIFVVIFSVVYRYVARFLTEYEIPRTQTEFTNSYIVKLYLLEFANNYLYIFYEAFMKGQFYTYPGDETTYAVLYGLKADFCEATGCILDIHISVICNLVVIMMVSLGRVYVPIFLEKLKAIALPTLDLAKLPQWEKDYYKISIPNDHLIERFMKLVIQHGYILFFASACPLAPLFAFIHNLFLIRLEAKNYVVHLRRRVAVQAYGIGIWNSLFKLTTFLAVIINSAVIAFTSQFVEKEVYRYTQDSTLHGYFESKFSEFNISDYPEFKGEQPLPPEGQTICYYYGKRYPPNHPLKYRPTAQFWTIYFARLLVLVLSEHIILLAFGIMTCTISPISEIVKEQVYVEGARIREMKKRTMIPKTVSRLLL